MLKVPALPQANQWARPDHPPAHEGLGKAQTKKTCEVQPQPCPQNAAASKVEQRTRKQKACSSAPHAWDGQALGDDVHFTSYRLLPVLVNPRETTNFNK